MMTKKKRPIKPLLHKLDIKRVFSPFVFLKSVQSLSRVQLFATPWTAACQASLSITNSLSLLRLIVLRWQKQFLCVCVCVCMWEREREREREKEREREAILTDGNKQHYPQFRLGFLWFKVNSFRKTCMPSLVRDWRGSLIRGMKAPGDSLAEV